MKVGDFQVKRVVVVDDNEDTRADIADMLTDVGIEPIVIESGFKDIESLTKLLPQKADVVLCDHQLNHANYSKILGAQIVEAYVKEKRPSILYTQAERSAIAREIRPRLPSIPGLVVEQVTEWTAFEKAIEWMSKELQGHPVRERERIQAMVEVDYFDKEKQHVYAFVNGGRQKVLVPWTLIPRKLQESMSDESVFLADVNLYAPSEELLFFENIRAIEEGEKRWVRA